ncbi:MAG: transcriptional regulator [Alphaproteobacteria bacterium]|jgi:predicted transcriptional regulator|nr:transcriptional regulator [Alphaproteobacteria bacterium]
MDDKSRADLLAHTAQIVAGYSSHNKVESLPALIREVFDTLQGLQRGEVKHVHAHGLEPAVSVAKSIMPDYLICLEDGKKMKMLKRYLKTAYNMTPEDYRAKWGLPDDYPMVAPNYAEKRSSLAKAIGLGTDGNRGRK